MALNLWSKLAFPTGKSLINFQQVRNTWVLDRVHPAPLAKPHKRSSLRQRHYVFKVVEDDLTKPQKMLDVVLKKYVEDLGQAGEVVTVKEQTGRLLIMTNKAAYTSEANLKKYAQEGAKKSYSSKYAATTIGLLNKFVLNISMNKETPWTLEPWHVRSAFRKAGVVVTESAITMPDHTISGPDMALENKEIFVTVTINGQEKAVVRARIHHWATNPNERLPPVRDHWKFPVDTVFVEDKEIAKTLPEMIPPVFDEDDEKGLQRIQRIRQQRLRQNI